MVEIFPSNTGIQFYLHVTWKTQNGSSKQQILPDDDYINNFDQVMSVRLYDTQGQ